VWKRGEVHIGFWARNPGEKIPLGMTMHIWKDNIKMRLRSVKWESTDWTNLAQIGTRGVFL
jgi:hypothetical protein